MSDRIKLAREIAARTKPRFVEENPKRPQAVEGMRKLARAIAARSEPRFITIPPQRGGSKVHFTAEQLIIMRGGLTAEQWWLNLIRWSSATPNSEPAPDSQANPASEPHDADTPAENPDADK